MMQMLNEVKRGALTRFLRALETGGTYIFLVSTYVSIAVNSLSMGLMSLTFLGISITERQWTVRRTPLDYYFAGFLIVQIIATIFSADPLQSIILSKRVLLIGLVYFFATIITTEIRARRLVATLLGTAVIVSVIGVIKLVLGGPGDNTRLGIFQFYMTTSELMTIGALLLFPFAVHPRTPRNVRWLVIAAMLPVLVALWATVTRGAYVAVTAGILFIAIVRNRRVVIPVILLVAVLILFSPPYIKGRIESIVDVNHPENKVRLELWKAGIAIFKDHPVVGVGDIDTGRLIDKYADPDLPRLWGHLHNTLLQVLVNYGVIGFIVFVAMFVRVARVEWVIFTLVREDWFKGSFAVGVLASLVAFFVNGLTEWNFGDQEVIILIWTTLGMLIGIGGLARGSSPPEPQKSQAALEPA
jgi:O-antigen ligase